MKEIIDALTTGQYKILYWFIAAIVFIYIPWMFYYLRKRKAKADAFERKNRNAVKVYLAFDIIGTLTVYSVDGKEPVFFYETTRQGFYMFRGKHKLGVQYHWATISPLSITGYRNYNISPRELEVTIEEGKTYSLAYNRDKDEYVFSIVEE